MDPIFHVIADGPKPVAPYSHVVEADGWLLVTGAVFSFMDGTVHPYYTVALAPAIADESQTRQIASFTRGKGAFGTGK